MTVMLVSTSTAGRGMFVHKTVRDDDVISMRHSIASLRSPAENTSMCRLGDRGARGEERRDGDGGRLF